ncbi:DUF3383 family protein [Commensalibacter nepenthis]|uniref:DUF3383 family protein n=1 Tax=Commensalibacter nepenthis TaxID=3043872 RepID=A0ABT6Q5B5_9PROT|nr:DUF3383 family protein [Commensalibacter sp. TBRC 10068]MDI2112091.1 DUF3383 family protein [Commensalibacter sp. TBRC 10068]
MSIPLNNIVKINPGVLDVGNNGNNLFGLMLTKSTGLPAGQTTTFTSADQVGSKFGYDSSEYNLATVYFAGFTNSDRVAAQLYMAPYYLTNPSISLIGGTFTSLSDLRNFTGKLSITIDQKAYDLAEVDLSRSKSLSDAAKKLSAAIPLDATTNKQPATISYGNDAMTITVENGGSNISASGELATNLCLTSETGARKSIVQPNTNIAKLLNTLRQTNLSFCSVFLAWDLADQKDLDKLSSSDLNKLIATDRAEKLEFAKWANSMKDDVCVLLNDANLDGKATNSETVSGSAENVKEEDLSIAEVVKKREYEGVVCTYCNPSLCAFIAGYPAAWDLTKTDGRFTAAFRRNSLLKANVQNESDALVLKAKGYNFYGVWASSTSNFTFMYEGRISGQYVWLDSWFCQVWMRRQLQYYFVMTLLARGQIPYNTDGKGILTTAIKPAIDQFANFGAIRSGISLADEQIQQLKQAGLNQSQINNITTVGYYLKIDMARVSPQIRVARGSPPIDFWYTDGQSVQQINMNSIEIQ